MIVRRWSRSRRCVGVAARRTSRNSRAADPSTRSGSGIVSIVAGTSDVCEVRVGRLCRGWSAPSWGGAAPHFCSAAPGWSCTSRGPADIYPTRSEVCGGCGDRTPSSVNLREGPAFICTENRARAAEPLQAKSSTRSSTTCVPAEPDGSCRGTSSVAVHLRLLPRLARRWHAGQSPRPLREKVRSRREVRNAEPSAGIVDSQSVKAPTPCPPLRANSTREAGPRDKAPHRRGPDRSALGGRGPRGTATAPAGRSPPCTAPSRLST